MKTKHVDLSAGDRATKRIVVGSLCAIAIAFALTVCVLSLRGIAIPDALDRLSIFILGVVGGLLSKTSTDAPQGHRATDPLGTPESPISVEATGEGGEPVKVETASPTTDVAG